MNTEKRNVLVTVSCTLLCAVVITFSLDAYWRSFLEERLELELTQLANTALTTLSIYDGPLDLQLLDNLADRLGHASETRVTLIDYEGTVLGDSHLSHEEVGVVENHATRPEVIQALKSGHGSSYRFSDTLRESMLYVAASNSITALQSTSSSTAPLRKQNIYVARAAVPISSITAMVAKMRFGLFLIILLGVLSYAVLGILYFRLTRTMMSDHQVLLERRVNDRTREIALLQSFSSLLNIAQSKDEAIEIIQKFSVTLLPGVSGAIFLMKPSKNLMELMTFWGCEPEGRRFTPTDCWALRKGHVHNSHESGAGVSCPHFGEMFTTETLCLPLSAQGDVLGSIHYSFDDVDSNEDNRRLAVSAGEQIGLSLANLKLREDLRHQAMRDSLTGLYNRRYLDEAIEMAIDVAKRHDSSLAVVMLDADHFKRFNDTYGHEVGDLILQRIAVAIQGNLRASDIPCRYGGEEFCIIYTDISLENAIRRAEKLRIAISLISLPDNEVSAGEVTASLGLSMFPEHADNAYQLLKIADGALYKAKSDGRNRLIVAMPTVDKGLSAKNL